MGTAPNQKTSVLFSIKDSGIGISPDLVAKVFDRFTQGSSDPTAKKEGSGLGLAFASG